MRSPKFYEALKLAGMTGGVVDIRCDFGDVFLAVPNDDDSDIRNTDIVLQGSIEEMEEQLIAGLMDRARMYQQGAQELAFNTNRPVPAAVVYVERKTVR